MKRSVLQLWKMFFVRKIFYPVHMFMHMVSLRGLGVLNFEDMRLSGEQAFLKKLFSIYTGDPVVLDVGANVGNYSMLVRHFSKTAKIYAFEPHPETFLVLKENAVRHGFTVYNFGCGEKEGTFKFYDSTAGSSQATFLKSAIEKTYGDPSIEKEASMVRVDDFIFKELGNQRIALLKIDAEGYDFMVLKGAEGLLRRDLVDVIQFEFNDINVVARVFFRDFYEFLSGYVFYRLLPDGPVRLGAYDPRKHEIFAFQNIIAVRRDLNLHF